MVKDAITLGAAETIPAAVRPSQPTRTLRHRFLRHKSAMIGGTIILFLTVAGLAGPFLARDPAATDLEHTLEPPSTRHPLGTDQLGRDLLSRLLSGARLSLVIGIVVVAISCTIGTGLGLVAGYRKSLFDFILMRFADVAMAFPGILLALLIITILGPGLFQTMVAVGIANIPRFLRIGRASALSVSEREFVLAARALGAGDGRILRLHILPNSLAPISVEATVLVGTSILIAASLSFLGLGVRPPTAEWGNMLSEGRDYLSVAPHIVTFPGLAILLTVLAFNLLGDGLRDVMDVKLDV